MKALAIWCVRHRIAVLLLWLTALIAMTLASQSIGTAYSNSFSLPNTESTRGTRPAAVRRTQAGRRPGADRHPHGHRNQGHRPRGHGRGHHHARQGGQGRPRHGDRQPVRTPGCPADQPRRPDRVRHGDLRQARGQHLDSSGQAVRHGGPVGGRPDAPGGRRRTGGRGGQPGPLRRHRSRRAAGRGRPPPRLRLGVRHGASTAVGPGVARYRHRGDRAAEPRAQDADVLHRTGPPDRARGGGRLRALHRDPAPAGPHRRR